VATIRFSYLTDGREDQITQVAGAATVTTNMELTIDVGNTMEGNTRVINKEEVLLGLKRLQDFIMKGGASQTGWPPQ
jgi:hypothetical protein